MRKECGLEVRILNCLGTADGLVYAAREATHYRKRGTFFLAEVAGYGGASEPGHQLQWMPVEKAISGLVHGSHRSALAEARSLAG